MDVVLEIVKITVPPLMVLAATIMLLRSFLSRETDAVKGLLMRDSQSNIARLKEKNRGITMPVRLQAYERMILFCSRIELGQLILRLHQNGMSAKALSQSLRIAVEEEFSHNITQQMYMSDELWNIIALAKLEALSIIKKVGSELDAKASAQDYIHALSAHLEKAPQTGNLQAQVAIKKEVMTLL